jgi:zinc/manganese transport system substrate-binding protein/manganese/iron transport system substrate-binding protein
MLRPLVAFLLLVPMLLLPGPARAAPTLKVLSTTTHIADVARNVAGGRVEVRSLLPPNADPHSYEPAPGDVRAIAAADVVLTHGLGLDHWAEKLIEAAGTGKPVYVVTVGIPVRPGDDESPEGDPHVWQNPLLVKLMANNVRDALSAVDPDGAATYAAGASRFNARLDRLDREIQAEIETIPRENRKMVTNHDAFHYYTDRYGLTFIGSVIPSTSTENDAPAGSLGRLIRLMIDRQVNAVFTENTVDTRVAQNIADQTGAKVVSGLIGDSLGEPGSGLDTYEAVMRWNTRIIVDALK